MKKLAERGIKNITQHGVVLELTNSLQNMFECVCVGGGGEGRTSTRLSLSGHSFRTRMILFESTNVNSTDSVSLSYW